MNDPQGIRILKKARDAKEAAALLSTQSNKVRDLIAARKKPPPAAVAMKRPPPPTADANAGSKKAKTTGIEKSVTAHTQAAPAASKTPAAAASTETAALAAAAKLPSASAADTAVTASNQSAPAFAPPARDVANPNDHELLAGKRVAKEFDEGIFFGNIKEYLPKGSVEDIDFEMWSVRYDDGDEEDLREAEIRAMLQLYEKEKTNDRPAGME